jgi:voltage-gated potassium channel
MSKKEQIRPDEQETEAERYLVLEQMDDWLEIPVMILGFVWLVLLVIELMWGLNPLLDAMVYVIWAIFVVDFAIRMILAPRKLAYLRQNWLTALSLLLPAMRILRFVRFLRLSSLLRLVSRLRLVRVVGSLNRSMRSLRASMARRGFTYVVALTVVVTLVGAAALFRFESEMADNPGFDSFGDALWWTAMIMTTLGSGDWPVTPEGRILGFLLALYAFAVFGYVTATLATFFLGREAAAEDSDVVGAQTIEALRAEIRALRSELQALSPREE